MEVLHRFISASLAAWVGVPAQGQAACTVQEADVREPNAGVLRAALDRRKDDSHSGSTAVGLLYVCLVHTGLPLLVLSVVKPACCCCVRARSRSSYT